jgi:hypothetical protein
MDVPPDGTCLTRLELDPVSEPGVYTRNSAFANTLWLRLDLRRKRRTDRHPRHLARLDLEMRPLALAGAALTDRYLPSAARRGALGRVFGLSHRSLPEH